MRTGQHYDLIVVTQDWHPKGHGSFASSHPGAEPFQLGELSGLPQMLWPDHCVEETNGAHLLHEIEQVLARWKQLDAKFILSKKARTRRSIPIRLFSTMRVGVTPAFKTISASKV